ncbi:MAG: addiction module antidote protein [Sphingosinicella sp.]
MAKKKIKLIPFDASLYLDDAESQAELLNDALESGKASYIARALGTIARARGMTDLQRLTGLDRSTLYAALREEGNPTLDTIMRVLKALEIELQATPKRAA